MARVRPDGPIITLCENTFELYPTVEDAAADMEGYDVIPGLWEAWDSRGYRLTLYAETEPAPVEVWFDPESAGTPELDAVVGMLRQQVENESTGPYPLEIDPDDATLDELIAELLRIRRLAGAPGPVLRFLRRIFGRPTVDEAE